MGSPDDSPLLEIYPSWRYKLPFLIPTVSGVCVILIMLWEAHLGTFDPSSLQEPLYVVGIPCWLISCVCMVVPRLQPWNVKYLLFKDHLEFHSGGRLIRRIPLQEIRGVTTSVLLGSYLFRFSKWRWLIVLRHCVGSQELASRIHGSAVEVPRWFGARTFCSALLIIALFHHFSDSQGWNVLAGLLAVVGAILLRCLFKIFPPIHRFQFRYFSVPLLGSCIAAAMIMRVFQINSIELLRVSVDVPHLGYPKGSVVLLDRRVTVPPMPGDPIAFKGSKSIRIGRLEAVSDAHRSIASIVAGPNGEDHLDVEMSSVLGKISRRPIGVWHRRAHEDRTLNGEASR